MIGFEEAVAELAPVAGGVTAVAYLLWRILNRDTSFTQIQDALKGENQRLSDQAVLDKKRIAELEGALELKATDAHTWKNDAIAYGQWLRMMVRAGRLCSCDSMATAMLLLPRDITDVPYDDDRN